MRAIRNRILVLVAVAAGFAVFASTALAAAPVLVSVGSVSRHPTATWTLPPGVQAKVAEVATGPATGSDGYFFFENVKAFNVLEDTQTSWTSTFQLDAGTYYVHIGGLDDPCFMAGLCPIREFSQTMTLEIRPDTYSVSLTKLGDGTGTVTANGTTISECGAATCAATFAAGISTTFLATAAPDSDFAGWGGACSGASPLCTVTIDGPKSITATFSKKPPPPPLRCVVPSLKGKTIAGARTALKKARCALGRITYAYSKMKKGHVIAQRPATRTIRPRGSRVQIVVSYGPKRR